MSLKVSENLPSSPVRSPGRRTEKSPARTACIANKTLRTSIADAGAGISLTETFAVATSLFRMTRSYRRQELLHSVIP